MLNFLVNTISAWDEPPRCRHQVAQALSKKANVLFVEKNRPGMPSVRVAPVSDNLRLLSPRWPVGGKLRHRVPIVNGIYQNWLFSRIRDEYMTKGNGRWEIVNFDFTAKQLFNFFPSNHITYYCNDDFIGNSSIRIRAIDRYHQLCESELIRKSKMCIATSDFLKEKMQAINNNTHLIPLGAPGSVPGKHLRFTNANKSVEKITVVYVGYMLPNKLAIDWIKECLTDDRFEFLMIGPKLPEVMNSFSSDDPVTFLGIQTGQELYSTLSMANVCVAPYNLALINRGTTPNKLWLYLSLGKPVVLTDIPNIHTWEFPTGFIYRTTERALFPHLIKRAFKEDNISLFEQRIQEADNNSWDNKISYFLKLIE